MVRARQCRSRRRIWRLGRTRGNVGSCATAGHWSVVSRFADGDVSDWMDRVALDYCDLVFWRDHSGGVVFPADSPRCTSPSSPARSSELLVDQTAADWFA